METLVYVLKSNLHYYPPCTSQIKMAKDAGVKVQVWYGSCAEHTIRELEYLGIECVELGEKRTGLPAKLDSLQNWLDFRRRFKEHLKDVDQSKTFFWFGTAETAIPLRGTVSAGHYAVTLLELLDGKGNALKRHGVEPLLKGASSVVCCEETRAYLTRASAGLQKLPYVMPNKPYGFKPQDYERPTCAESKAALEQLGDKPFIIYQGIIQDVDMLAEVAKALNDFEPQLELVLMGLDIRNENTVQTIREYYPNVTFIPYIPAPKHLEVTRHATLGLVFYNDDTLNKAYCAPNKIYEYSGFGIPILANDIPGLKNTIGKAGAGECVRFEYTAIKEALQLLFEKHDDYAQNGLRFFDGTDNMATTIQLLTDAGFKLA